MAVVHMQKIRLLIASEKTSDVLEVLQKKGIVELSEVVTENKALQKKEKTVFELNYVSSRLDFAVDFLKKYEVVKDGFRRSMEGEQVTVDEKLLKDTIRSFEFNSLIDTLQTLEQKLNFIDEKIKKLEEEKTLLEEWKNFTTPLHKSFETQQTQTQFLIFSQENSREEKEVLQQLLTKNNILFAFKHIDETHAILTTLKKDALEKIFTEAKVKMQKLPKRRGTIIEELERVSRAIRNNTKRREYFEGKIRAQVKYLSKFKILSDYMFWKKEKHNTLMSALSTKTVSVFEGWCPKKEFTALKVALGEVTQLFSLEKIKAGKDEEVPVEIKNKKIFQPFESVTRLYGLPGHTDLDPTPYLSLFFFIFFGFCLTDVGYGIVLMIMTGLALMLYRLPKAMKSLFSLLFLGGFSSFLGGLFFGGYLGINMESMPVVLQNIQSFDPIANPLPVFYLALALGVIQIMTGLMLGIVSAAKNKKAFEGFLDKGPWLSLFISLILFGAQMLGFIGEAFPATFLVYFSLAFIFLANARKGEGVFGKIVSGLAGLYESIGYFSDVLSYSRLLALGLATSALAFAVNLIAEIVGDMIPYIGWLIAIGVLIVGHMFNVAVNTLGAFIHSARLQFVEFFGKFVSGSGREFTPFRREERNVYIKK